MRQSSLSQMPANLLPCHGCTTCCERELLMLHPELGDDPAEYDCVPATNPVTGRPCLVLRIGARGTCCYLGERGCTIWPRRPAICREFNCVEFVRLHPELATGALRHAARKCARRLRQSCAIRGPSERGAIARWCQ